MSRETAPDPLGKALRSLPRARPTGEFTERVLERIEGERRGRMAPLPLRWAAAAAFVVTVAAAALTVVPRTGSGEAAADRRARVEDLEAERLLLAAELDEIRRLAAELREPAPVLYLGGDERVDLVLDLERLVRDEAGGRGPTPASYRSRRPY